MIETRVVELEGRNSTDYQSQINAILKEGWKFTGTMGKSNTLMIFTREITIAPAE